MIGRDVGGANGFLNNRGELPPFLFDL